MYEVNSIGIEIAKLILKNKKIVKEYVRNTLLSKKKLLNFLKQKNVDYKDTRANFVLIDKNKINKKIFNYCKKKNILISSKIFFNKFIRVTVGPQNEMRVFFNILKKNIN